MVSKLVSLAAQLKCQLATPNCIAILGSMYFGDQQTEAICTAFGYQLALAKNLCLLTGGVTGVPKVVSQSFWRSPPDASCHIYHLQPQGFAPLDYGKNIVAGDNLIQKRWLLAQLAAVYVLFSGGPGTDQEVRWALENGATIIPVGISGGCAEQLHQELTQNAAWLDQQWRSPKNLRYWHRMNDPRAAIEDIAEAIYELSLYSVFNRAKK
ncbi:MAG: hypothetical protein WBB82_16325 [Limnothrix sp.]